VIASLKIRLKQVRDALQSPRVVLGVAARVAAVGFQFLIVHWYAKTLPASELGTFYFLSTVSYIINAVILVPVDLAQQPKALEVWLSRGSAYPTLLLQGKLIIIFLAISLLGEVFVATYFPEKSGIVLLLTLMALASYSLASWRTFFNNIKWNRIVILNYIADPGLRYLSLIVLLRLHWITPRSILFGAGFSYFLISAACITLLYFKKGFQKCLCNEFRIKGLIRQASALSFLSMTNLIQMQGYRLLLVPLGYSEEVGKYALVSQLGITATGSAGAIYGMVRHPEIYRSPESQTKPFVGWGIALLVFLCVGAMTAGPFILHFITAGKYTMLFPLIVLGILIEGGNLLGGALGIGPTKRGAVREIISSSVFGLTGFFLMIGPLLFYHCVNIWTIGLPLLFSQITAVGSLYLMERDQWR
jgi:hypothetical protein